MAGHNITCNITYAAEYMLPKIFPNWLPAVYNSSNCCIFSPTFRTFHLLYFSYFGGCVKALHCGFNFHFSDDY